MNDSEEWDRIARAQAAGDQLVATMRDTLIPAIVALEKDIIREGGSPELALSIAKRLGHRMIDVATGAPR